jgi:hypothetical protein
MSKGTRALRQTPGQSCRWGWLSRSARCLLGSGAPVVCGVASLVPTPARLVVLLLREHTCDECASILCCP